MLSIPDLGLILLTFKNRLKEISFKTDTRLFLLSTFHFFIRNRGNRAGISEDMIYPTTCFVRNWVLTFSEKNFPTSPDRMRSV